MSTNNSGNYKHGKEGTVTIGGYSLPVRSFGYEAMAELADVTNARSGGYGEDIAGIKRLSGTCECIWDADQYPTRAPLNLSPGNEVTLNLKLHTGETGVAPVAIIGKLTTKSGVKGEVTYSFDWKSQGAYTLPT